MKTLRLTFLVLAVAALLAGFGATASPRARAAVVTQSGLKIVVQYGPVCTRHPHKMTTCVYQKLVGWKVQLLQGSQIVVSGTTNRAGTVTLLAAPGRYSYTISGVLNGRPVNTRRPFVPVYAGKILPFYFTVGN